MNRKAPSGGSRSVAGPVLIGFAGILLAGCATTPSGAGTGSGPTPARTSTVPVAGVEVVDPIERVLGEVRRHEPGSTERFTALAFDAAADPARRRRLVEGAAGSEIPLLEHALAEAAHEAREVGPVLHDLAAAVGRRGTDEDRLAVVRETSGRECCLRRSFLAAALDGLADGLAAAASKPGPQAEAALRLRELMENRDPGVAAAAGRVAAYYPVPGGR